MPTQPLETILYRERSIASARESIDKVSPLLQEVVNYSTNVFARCVSSVPGGIENYAVPLIYLHMIEMTDGIEVLLSASCPTPAKLLLRSLFEAFLSVEYILEENYENRALAWIASFVRKRLALYRSHDPSTIEGRQFLDVLKDDKLVGDVRIQYPAEFDNFIKRYEDLLSSPELAPVHGEIERYRREKNRKPRRWYHLFGPQPPRKTPQNVEELAKHLEMGAVYERLYREWSAIHHVTEPARFISTKGKRQAIRPLRDPSQIEMVADFAEVFMVRATGLVLQKFRSGEEGAFAKWYLGEVKKYHTDP
jgi:hypothetical protein